MSEIQQVGTGPQERLLAHNATILELQEAVRVRKIQTKALLASGLFATLSSLAIFTVTVAAWGKYDMGPINRVAIPLTLLSGVLFARLLYVESERDSQASKTVRRLQLDLELAEERRRLYAAHLGLPVYQRQYAYKEDIPRELGQLRSEAKYYRRIHNAFQATIIIGSLGTTTAASLAETSPPLKWITVGLSLAVGISAGFTGYFKYRERSFYLQQTADSIEQHTSSFELGIPPYDDADESRNLYKLAKEIELLRVEQRKRQQQLDQPHEGKEGTV
ncbi:DUF4231 domain-containing protein [Streptosporangium sp. NPDC000509]|uniref:DUF4231 domain-containing protein n=1 Tax=Streptosporangium sp. NPDC000509 TaxID=3366186 RepID=UPI0036B5FBAA